MTAKRRLIGIFVMAMALPQLCWGQNEADIFQQAQVGGKLANEGFRRCDHYVKGWLTLADTDTGLIPRSRKYWHWNAKDAAADNYPFMVLTTSFTDLSLYTGRMKEMLATEITLTSRIDRLPDTYDFEKKGFKEDVPHLGRIIYGSSEYVKDGLLPLTEWLGPSPWTERMIGIIDDIWKHATIDTPHGKIASTNVEVNGELLQVLSRVYWMTGDNKYLEWAVRLGDYYLLGTHHPTRDANHLRLRDHGCEIVSGLCELYATVHFAMSEKKKEYEKPIHEMLDRILEVGRNEHGLFFNAIDPKDGTQKVKGIADTWGYTYNGFYTVYLVDGTEAYRTATIEALSNINDNYRNYNWENGSADGYADAIEGALYLYNRERIESAAEWIDSEIRVMWEKQTPNGIIEYWHCDGNFARTTLMYCLWKTKGLKVHPWRVDVVFGAVQEGNDLYLSITAEKKWDGRILFDTPRHQTIMQLPMDWPRINQFPEWFTVDSNKSYDLHNVSTGKTRTYTGGKLHEGIAMSVKAGSQQRIQIVPAMTE